MNKVELGNYTLFKEVHRTCHDKAFNKKMFYRKFLPSFLRRPIDLPNLIIRCYHSNGLGSGYVVVCPFCKKKQDITDYDTW